MSYISRSLFNADCVTARYFQTNGYVFNDFNWQQCFIYVKNQRTEQQLNANMWSKMKHF